MTDPANRPQVRIGNAERDAAMKALDAHLSAGRLDLDEYGERYAKVSVARTQDELTALFTDLPQPAPFIAPIAHMSQPVQRDSGALFGRFGEAAVALSPFIALALFFTVVHIWLVFLLIPASGALVYGRRGRSGRHGWFCHVWR
jgi:hypothetical protein